ncbi:MAG: Rpp14/Pop5 family protein [Candidatus Bathyarchaeia archaeon]
MTYTHKRYLLLEVDHQGLIDWKIIYTRLIKTLSNLFGEFGLAHTELRSITSKRDLIIVQCRRGEEHMVRCATLMLTSMEGQPLLARTLKTSGTLKSLKGFLNKDST